MLNRNQLTTGWLVSHRELPAIENLSGNGESGQTISKFSETFYELIVYGQINVQKIVFLRLHDQGEACSSIAFRRQAITCAFMSTNSWSQTQAYQTYYVQQAFQTGSFEEYEIPALMAT